MPATVPATVPRAPTPVSITRPRSVRLGGTGCPKVLVTPVLSWEKPFAEAAFFRLSLISAIGYVQSCPKGQIVLVQVDCQE